MTDRDILHEVSAILGYPTADSYVRLPEILRARLSACDNEITRLRTLTITQAATIEHHDLADDGK